MINSAIHCVHQEAKDRAVFTTLFDEVCQKFNISVPASADNGTAHGTNVTAEYWGSGSGDYGSGGGGNYGGGGGGGRGWRGAASSVNVGTQFGWIIGGVTCTIALNALL